MELCVLCKKNIEGISKVFTTEPETKICGTCFERISYIKQFSRIDDNLVANKSFEVLSGYLSDMDDKNAMEKLNDLLVSYNNGESYEKRTADARERAKENAIKTAKENARKLSLEQKKNVGFLMTSVGNLEGYKIVGQLGLVFGETILGMSMFKSIAAKFKDFGSGLKTLVSSQEMSGTMDVISEARQYAINKMKSEAVELGANAIVGIDAETSFGGDIVHITIYGTAVYVEPVFDGDE